MDTSHSVSDTGTSVLEPQVKEDCDSYPVFADVNFVIEPGTGAFAARPRSESCATSAGSIDAGTGGNACIDPEDLNTAAASGDMTPEDPLEYESTVEEQVEEHPEDAADTATLAERADHLAGQFRDHLQACSEVGALKPRPEASDHSLVSDGRLFSWDLPSLSQVAASSLKQQIDTYDDRGMDFADSSGYLEPIDEERPLFGPTTGAKQSCSSISWSSATPKDKGLADSAGSSSRLINWGSNKSTSSGRSQASTPGRTPVDVGALWSDVRMSSVENSMAEVSNDFSGLRSYVDSQFEELRELIDQVRTETRGQCLRLPPDNGEMGCLRERSLRDYKQAPSPQQPGTPRGDVSVDPVDQGDEQSLRKLYAQLTADLAAHHTALAEDAATSVATQALELSVAVAAELREELRQQARDAIREARYQFHQGDSRDITVLRCPAPVAKTSWLASGPHVVRSVSLPEMDDLDCHAMEDDVADEGIVLSQVSVTRVTNVHRRERTMEREEENRSARAAWRQRFGDAMNTIEEPHQSGSRHQV